jgi:hypothetical protein
MSCVVTKIELDAAGASLGRATLWAIRVLHKPPSFPGAEGTRPWFIPSHLMEVARGLDVGDEVEIDTQPGPVLESMAGLRLLRKGPIDWRQYKTTAARTKPAEDIDLDFRPESYWKHPGRKRANIKGHLRRKRIAARDAGSNTEPIPPEMREDSISEASKTLLLRMHPSFRSGEDLPDYLEDEVEIARLANTYTVFCEVTSIRARREAGRIKYRIVDEYESTISCARDESERPLSLREVIDLIDTASQGGIVGFYFGVFEDWWLRDEQSSPTEWAGSIEVSSTFYPKIGAYYDEAFKVWCETKNAERARKRPGGT